MDIIVTPIDPTAPGSYRERKRLMGVARKLDDLREGNMDWRAVLEAYDAVEALLLPRLKTDNGMPIEDALDLLSADQFDELLGKVTMGTNVIPPENANSSSSPSEVTEVAPTG